MHTGILKKTEVIELRAFNPKKAYSCGGEKIIASLPLPLSLFLSRLATVLKRT